MNAKAQIGIAAIVLLLAGTIAAAGFTLGAHRAAAASAVHNNCSNPAPNEVCPSDSFLNDFQNWKALKVQIDDYQRTAEAKKQQALVDQFNGMTNRLRDEVNAVGVPDYPPGSYDFVEDKNRLIKKAGAIKAAATPAATATPAPATPGPKAK